MTPIVIVLMIVHLLLPLWLCSKNRKEFFRALGILLSFIAVYLTLTVLIYAVTNLLFDVSFQSSIAFTGFLATAILLIIELRH